MNHELWAMIWHLQRLASQPMRFHAYVVLGRYYLIFSHGQYSILHFIVLPCRQKDSDSTNGSQRKSKLPCLNLNYKKYTQYLIRINSERYEKDQYSIAPILQYSGS